MALSLRRCSPLNGLCRQWPRSPSVRLHPSDKLNRHDVALATFSTKSKLRPLRIPASSLRQSRALSDVKPPHVNVSLRNISKTDEQYVPPKTTIAGDTDLHESPYTIPNALTVGRIIACPFLGYHIVQGNLEWATGILLVGGLSDWVGLE